MNTQLQLPDSRFDAAATTAVVAIVTKEAPKPTLRSALAFIRRQDQQIKKLHAIIAKANEERETARKEIAALKATLKRGMELLRCYDPHWDGRPMGTAAIAREMGVGQKAVEVTIRRGVRRMQEHVTTSDRTW